MTPKRTLRLVGAEDPGNPVEPRVLERLIQVDGQASVGKTAEFLGLPPAAVQAAMDALVNKGKVASYRYVDGVFYAVIPGPN